MMPDLTDTASLMVVLEQLQQQIPLIGRNQLMDEYHTLPIFGTPDLLAVAYDMTVDCHQ
jgi:hypothetical protein